MELVLTVALALIKMMFHVTTYMSWNEARQRSNLGEESNLQPTLH